MRRLSNAAKGRATHGFTSSDIRDTLDWLSSDIDSSAMLMKSDRFSTSMGSCYMIPRASLIYFLLIGHPLWKIALPKISTKSLRFFLMSSCFQSLLLFWLAFFFWKQRGTGFFKFSLITGSLSFLTSSRYFSTIWQVSVL